MRKNNGWTVCRLIAAPPPQRHVALTVQVLNVFRVLWLFIVADSESEYVRRVHCSLSLVTFRSVSQAVASIITGNLGVTAACRITSSLIDTHWTHYPVLPARSFISLKGYGIVHSFHGFVATDSTHIFSFKHNDWYSKEFNCNYLFNRTTIGQQLNKYRK